MPDLERRPHRLGVLIEAALGALEAERSPDLPSLVAFFARSPTLLHLGEEHLRFVVREGHIVVLRENIPSDLFVRCDQTTLAELLAGRTTFASALERGTADAIGTIETLVEASAALRTFVGALMRSPGCRGLEEELERYAP